MKKLITVNDVKNPMMLKKKMEKFLNDPNTFMTDEFASKIKMLDGKIDKKYKNDEELFGSLGLAALYPEALETEECKVYRDKLAEFFIHLMNTLTKDICTPKAYEMLKQQIFGED